MKHISEKFEFCPRIKCPVKITRMFHACDNDKKLTNIICSRSSLCSADEVCYFFEEIEYKNLDND